MVFMIYNTLDNLQQIVDTYKSLTNPIIELLHLCTVDSLFFNQSESYYTFCTVAQRISELLHFFALFTCTRKTCCNIIWHLLRCS